MMDTIALWVGWWVLLTVGGVLGALVITLVVDAVKPWRKPTPNSAPVSTTPAVRAPLAGYWNDAAVDHPHPLHDLTLYVDAADDATAWKAIQEKAS